MTADFTDVRGFRWRQKDCAPGSLHAFRNVAALMKEMCRAETGGARGFCRGSRALIAAEIDVGVRIELLCCGRKVILPNTQSIIGLWQVSQLYPRTMEQAESSRVMKKSCLKVSPVRKVIGNVVTWVINVLEEPSKSFNSRGGIVVHEIEGFEETKLVSIKQWDDPESKWEWAGSEKYRDKSGVYRVLGSERAEALRWTKLEVARSGSTQSSDHAFRGLLSIFLTVAPYLFPELVLP